MNDKLYRLNQAAVDEQLQPRQEHLRRIVATLESEDASDAAEVDERGTLVFRGYAATQQSPVTI